MDLESSLVALARSTFSPHDIAPNTRRPQETGRPGKESARLGPEAALTATVMIYFGDAFWWRISWEWKLHQAFYDAGVWVIVGLVLAKFVASSQGCTRSKLHKRNDIAAVSAGPLTILPEARGHEPGPQSHFLY